MGASSSTTASGVKGRRKISRVSAEEGQVEDPTARASRLMMQNGQLGTGGEWHTKAHSMYELQREKSTEAGGGGGGSLEEAEREHGNGNGNGNGNVQQNGMNSNNMNNNKELGTTKASPKRRKSNAAGKRDDLAMNSRQQSPRPVTGGGSLEGPTSPSSPSNSSAQPQKPTQRRRPLTWAWLRGHEVSLPGTGAAVLEPVGAARKPTAAAMAATRRRSLKVGTESSLAVSAANTEWGIQRQLSSSSANSAASTSAQPATTVPAHVPLVRRASQGRPLLAQLGRQKSIRKSDAGLASQHNPISASGREIIQFCFDQPHNEIGVRICSRLLEKRPDFRSFVYTMGKERWLQMTARLKDFLETVVRRVDNIDIVERVARKYGEEHVELKAFGFKPDFWVSLADAITVECVILDQATHQPSDTITAWSLLVSIMFSAVRDGYYQAMRAQRISQRHKNVHQREQALRVVDGGATSPAPSSAGTGGGGGGGSGVEKSASANELQSPGKKGAGTAFRFGDSGLISEEAEGRKCSREEKKDQQPSKKSNKTVEFF